MTQKIIIFGCTGQDGVYLTELLKYYGYSVYGVSRAGGDFICDVSDRSSVNRIIETVMPDYVFQFAAISSTADECLHANYSTIVDGTINILEAIQHHCPDCRVFIPGSALQFKNTGSPINEDQPFEARDSYSLARISSVYAARYFRHRFGIKTFVGYLFHHDSPLRNKNHLPARIADTIRKILNGEANALFLGAPEVIREFNFAGDIVRAMWTLVSQDQYTEAVIGSGKGYSIQSYVEACFTFAGLDSAKYFHRDAHYKADFSRCISDPARICAMGWTPTCDFNQYIKMMMKGECSKWLKH